MGFRTDNAYERAEEARRRAAFRALPLRTRMMLRIRSIAVMMLLLLLLALWAAYSAGLI